MPDAGRTDRGDPTRDPGERLDSWKAIAAYLQRDVRTLHRWEHEEALPVHRHLHKNRGTVYAFRHELDAWRNTRLTGSARRASAAVRTAPVDRPRASLAVLPFANLSGKAAEQYFSDGLTEDVINELGRRYAASLVIIARTSVVQYRDTRKPIREIGRELAVDFALEGTVRRYGDGVRVTAQLIAVADQNHLWAESYDRPLRDILALQRDLAAAVVRAIGLALTVDPDASRPPALDPAAFEAYLKGRFHWYQLSPAHFDKALSYFELALERDPGFALAYEGIARVWLLRGDTGLVAPADASAQARMAALKALELDDALDTVHVTLANCRFCFDWDWSGAEREFQLAISLNANAAEAHFFYSDFLISMGRRTEAIEAMDRALRLDPFNFFFQCFRGWHLNYLGRLNDAVAQLRQVLLVEPSLASARLGLWGALYKQGRTGQALEEARRFFAALGDQDVCDALRSPKGAGYRRAMRSAADLLAARAASRQVPAVRIARMYAHAEDVSLTMLWLERAYERHESPLVHLAIGWDWGVLRNDWRYRRLLRLMNFPPSAWPSQESGV